MCRPPLALTLSLWALASVATAEEPTVYRGPHAEVVARVLNDARARGLTFSFPTCPTCTDFQVPDVEDELDSREAHWVAALQKAFLVEFYARFGDGDEGQTLAESMMADLAAAGEEAPDKPLGETNALTSVQDEPKPAATPDAAPALPPDAAPALPPAP